MRIHRQVRTRTGRWRALGFHAEIGPGNYVLLVLTLPRREWEAEGWVE